MCSVADWVIGFGGVALGFALSFGADWWASRRAAAAHRGALRAEIKYCKEMAAGFLQDSVQRPLYRLPTAAYGAALPELLRAAELQEKQTGAIIAYYVKVAEINRGLDLADAVYLNLDGPQQGRGLAQEDKRNRVKATALVNDLFVPAIGAIG